MIDIARRLEYIFLKKTSRPNIGKFVATEIVSCQLHDSNLINVQLSRTLRVLDLGKPEGTGNAQESRQKQPAGSVTLKYNQLTECSLAEI
jgi:hypothetical protein